MEDEGECLLCSCHGEILELHAWVKRGRMVKCGCLALPSERSR